MNTISNQPQVTGTHHHHHHHGQGKAVQDAVANLLGMSPDDLKAQEKQGKSLADVAAAKGVSKEELASTIQQALQRSDRSLSADRAQQLAVRIAGHVPGRPQQDPSTGSTSGLQPDGSFLAGDAQLASTPPAQGAGVDNSA